MKTIIGAAISFILVCSAIGQGLTSVELDGRLYTNIQDAHLGPHGLIILRLPSGGTSANADKFPSNFLASWNIKAETAKAVEAADSAAQLERAISAGFFREVEGVVYDIRKPQSGWVTYPKAKVIQVSEGAAIVNVTPDAGTYLSVHVKHFPASVGDTDTLSITAKLVGNYSYVNQLGGDRTIREYDMGHVCSRDEIPESVLSGHKAFDVAVAGGSPNKDMLATVPESSKLKATGSGFFITSDGYLISNNHVVEGATKVRVVTSTGTVDAKVVKVDAANDLALLKAEGKFSVLPIVASRSARLGGTVATVGFPDVVLQGFSPKLAKGEISSLSGIKDDPRFFQISVPVQPGNSGGALVDDHGNVVGVVAAKLSASAALAATGDLPENVNYAVKSSLLLSFLESSPDVAAKLKDSTNEDRRFDDVVQSAQSAAVLVLVY